MDKKTVISLFVASPGDVPRERQRLNKIIEQINATVRSDHDCIVNLKKWETHTYSSAGRPEEQIISQIGEYDVFLGIMWKRFGSSTGKTDSGTEEEFLNAIERLQSGGIKHVGFLFCERKIPFPSSQLEIDQIAKVVAFKNRIEQTRSLLYKTYSTLDDYDREVRQFVYGVIDNLCSRNTAQKRKSDSIDIDTEIELAKKYSSLGKYDKALEVLIHLSDISAESQNHYKTSVIEHLIALQYRQTGRFTEALEHYAIAEANILKSSPLSPEGKILYLRIKAGRIMVDEYFLKGLCRKAFSSYEGLKPDIEDIRNEIAVRNGPDSHLIDLYELHLLRQQAEMLRVSGQYSKSLRLFNDIYERYGFSYALEKAYCLVGIGDSFRLIGDFESAVSTYAKCEQHAIETKHNGLLSRVLRNKVMALFALSDGSYALVRSEINRLSDVQGSTSRFNQIYYLLAAGMIELIKTPDQAERLFLDAISLTSTKQGFLKIEHLHGNFGLAESRRISNGNGIDFDTYSSLYNEYKKIGLNWGIARTAAICKTARESSKWELDLHGDSDFEGDDEIILSNVNKSILPKSFSFFSNVP